MVRSTKSKALSLPIKIVIFGAGDFGVKAHRYYSKTHDIIAFVDSDPRKTGMCICGTKVYLPKDLPSIKWNRIFVASGHADEIIELLACDYGISGDDVYKVPVSLLHNEMDYGTDYLETLVDRLERTSVSYWLDYSSLLGLIRDNNPTSKDIDLCICIDNAPELIRVLNEYLDAVQVCVYHYIFNSELWGSDDVRQVKLFGYIDIHIKIKRAQDYFWLVGPMLLKADANFYQGYETRVWRGAALRVPRKPDEYLKMLYGAWEEPVAEWSYSNYRNIEKVFCLEEMQGCTV